MNILAIGAHFDDVELGCGGALARHAANGDTVYVYVATVSGFSNQYDQSVRSSQVARAEADAAMEILGVHKMFCGEFKTLQIEFVDPLNIEILKLVQDLKIDMRLYEATGVGSLLITDRKDNLGEIFDVGKEVVAYSSPEEAAELIRYYIDHPDEADAIAKAGQARTLKDHTYKSRMKELMPILERHLENQG